jgi:hypothetical protein
MPYSFQDLNPGEVSWVADQLGRAIEFAGGKADGPLPTLAQFDAAFTRFVESDPLANERANAVVLMLGAALGTHLVQTLGFEWVIATDDYGTDLAVVARRGRGDITLFPSDFVAKRWERRETGFLTDVPRQVSTTLAESEQSWSSHGA